LGTRRTKLVVEYRHATAGPRLSQLAAALFAQRGCSSSLRAAALAAAKHATKPLPTVRLIWRAIPCNGIRAELGVSQAQYQGCFLISRNWRKQLQL